MGKRNLKKIPSDQIDEQIDFSLQKYHPDVQDPPTFRAIHNLQQYYAPRSDAALPLERVHQRLKQQNAARPKVISLPKMDQQQERTSYMQNMVDSLPQSKTKNTWTRRLSVFAAILCTMVLVGSLLVILNMAGVNSTTSAGSHIEVTPTAPKSASGTPTNPGALPVPSTRPIDGPASQVIVAAVLTNSLAGNSEGIGPSLTGLPGATNQFTIGQKFWVRFTLNSPGIVTVKWFANNQLYSSASLDMSSWGPTPTPGSTVYSTYGNLSSITYNQAAEGKVELYWNGHLAVTLLFVVKPKAS